MSKESHISSYIPDNLYLYHENKIEYHCFCHSNYVDMVHNFFVNHVRKLSRRSSVGRTPVLSHVVRQWHLILDLSPTNDCMQAHRCHTGHQDVSRCCTRGESEESIVCRQQSRQAKESTLALKPRVDVTRSPKTKISVTPQKGLMPSFF